MLVLASTVGLTALGLSIVRVPVELHGGTVTVASEGDGRGATFTVRMPLAAPASRLGADAVRLEMTGERAGR